VLLFGKRSKNFYLFGFTRTGLGEERSQNHCFALLTHQFPTNQTEKSFLVLFSKKNLFLPAGITQPNGSPP
jgi:hypothetical protein